MKTKKRILAMLLAVVLCFSTLPFSVSADEISSEFPAESTVESQPEEPPAEETEEPAPAEDTITISDSSGDVPVVYAIDPYDEIKNKAEGGSNDMTQYGVTRAKIVSHLESHEHDDFYLGTPYQGGDWQSPNGDTSYNGSAGMNCTGFVSYVLRACGLNTGTFLEQLSLTGSTVWAGSGLPYDLMSGASNYLNAVQNGDIAAYTFRDKSELLASGLAQKGDIILMWWSLSPFDDGADNHIGFFWGDSSSEDKMWHSSTHPQSGNQISEIVPKTPGSYFILIKTENEEPTYSVTLTKTSADVSITQGNSGIHPGRGHLQRVRGNHRHRQRGGHVHHGRGGPRHPVHTPGGWHLLRQGGHPAQRLQARRPRSTRSPSTGRTPACQCGGRAWHPDPQAEEKGLPDRQRAPGQRQRWPGLCTRSATSKAARR